ncbi:unnamed protein product [Effrenium voratum]|nr:unnamed protein product [Effrenium voratum]
MELLQWFPLTKRMASRNGGPSRLCNWGTSCACRAPWATCRRFCLRGIGAASAHGEAQHVGSRMRRRFRLVLAIFLAWQGTGLVMCPDETSFAEMRLPVSAQLLRSGSSVALQGLRPILPGHCLVVPERPVPRLRDLPEDAMLDLWRTTLQANQQLLKQLGATASNWAVFDGWQAGQPVQHTHVHVVPRKPKDLERNDEVYEALERWKPSEAEGGEPPPIAWPTDEARKKRDSEEMAAEAAGYRALLPGESSFPAEQAFASFRIPRSHLFYASPSGLTVAFVNLKPLIPGHVLVVPRRTVPRLADLSQEEFDDLFRSVRVVQGALESSYGAEASRLGIQDGLDAGQTVPHVHVHVLPIPAKL